MNKNNMYNNFFFRRTILIFIKKCEGAKRRYGTWLTLSYLKSHNVMFNPKKCNFSGRTYLHISDGGNVVFGDYFIANSGVEAGIDCNCCVK